MASNNTPLTAPILPTNEGATSMPDLTRHRWKILGIGVLANASFSAAFSGIPMTAIALRSDYRLDNIQLGLAMGALGLGVALSELPWGVLTDRWGDRRVLLIGLFATALALMLMAIWIVPGAAGVPPVAFLALGLLLVGMLGGSVNGASGRAVMGWFHEGERGLAMSIRQTAVPLGGGAAALVLPYLAVSFGFMPVFALLALLCSGSGALAWRWLHEPPPANTVHVGKSDLPAKAATALRNIGVWRMALATGILCFPQVSILTFASIFLHDAGHASLLLISTSLAMVQIGAAVTRIWSGRWTDRHRNRRAYLRACSLLSVLLFVVLACLAACAGHAGQSGHWSPTMLLSMTGVLIAGGICASAWHGVAYTELATLAGARQVGTALGLGNTCVFLVFFLAAQIVPALLAWQAWPAVWLAGAVAALLAWKIFLAPGP
ncbi:MFS family permease [Herbaspirillum sp. Sphag1AN]|nr:MFS family permease [Herbaspirillum sp. Sphag1AN]MBB3245328.1 MFS family permease [Herbaspirillum sp. Sphag64]